MHHKENQWVSLFRRTKNVYYGNMDALSATDNEKLWGTVELFLLDKSIMRSTTNSIQQREIPEFESAAAELLKCFFFQI